MAHTTIQELSRLLASNDLRSQQAQREASIIKQAVDKALSSATDVAQHHGASVFTDRISDIIDMAANLQLSIGFEKAAGRRLSTHHLQVLALQTDQIAGHFFLQLMSLMVNADEGVFKRKRLSFYTQLGRAIEAQARYNVLEALAKGEGVNVVGVLERILRDAETSERGIKQAMTRFGQDLDGFLSDIEILRLGELVTDALLPALSGLIEMRKLSDGSNEVYYVEVVADVAGLIEQTFIDNMASSSSLGYMICEPRPIARGLLDIKHRYMTVVNEPKQDAAQLGKAAIDGANMLQSVAYNINTPLLETLQALGPMRWRKLLDIEYGSKKPLAERVCALRDFSRALEAAVEAVAYERIWFPAYVDFRGRMYQSAYKDFGPQGHKGARALLMFADETTPLGDSGMDALYLELGNAMGWDKDILSVKLEKAKAMDVVSIAADPLINTEWLEADEPVQALAVIVELANALASGNPETYVSRIAVGYDGCNNGLQHISLLMADEVGAEATNVVSVPSVRRDIYSEVAKAAAELTSSEELKQRDDLRKIAKTPVMTVGYNVTKSGMLKQIFEAAPELDKDLAAELRDGILSGIEAAVPRAMELREWLSECARRLGSVGEVAAWALPTGTIVRPRYLKYGYRSVRLLGSKTNLPDTKKIEGVDVGKSVRGIVANVIHSLDACGLQLTLSLLADNGVSNVAAVHDAYLCAPGNAALLSESLRRAHVELYSYNILEGLYVGFLMQAAGRVEIPEPPVCGDLDVSAVMASPYFFA